MQPLCCNRSIDMPEEKTRIPADRMPRHVAIIMDGNGRWAEKKGVSRIKGHTAGMEAMKEIIRKSSHMGIKYLTVYAFSTEN